MIKMRGVEGGLSLVRTKMGTSGFFFFSRKGCHSHLFLVLSFLKCSNRDFSHCVRDATGRTKSAKSVVRLTATCIIHQSNPILLGFPFEMDERLY